MFFWRNRSLELSLRIETDLRDLITDLRSQLSARDAEISLLRGKIDRMELVLMPLSSQAGAQYVRLLQPSVVNGSHLSPERQADKPVETNWQVYLKRHMAQMEADAEKEKSNGTHS